MQGFLELVQLAQIDWQIKVIETEIDTADDGRMAKKELDALKAMHAKLEPICKKLKTDLNDLKLQAEKAEGEKKKMDSQLYSTGINPKQISDIQTRLTHLKSVMDELETKELELMDTLEQADAKLAKISSAINQKTNELETKLTNYKNLKTKGEIKIAELEREREATRGIVEKELLRIYDKLRDQKGVAMAEVTNDLCNGCHQPISVALYQALKTDPEELHYCNNCGRLVFMRRTVS